MKYKVIKKVKFAIQNSKQKKGEKKRGRKNPIRVSGISLSALVFKRKLCRCQLNISQMSNGRISQEHFENVRLIRNKVNHHLFGNSKWQSAVVKNVECRTIYRINYWIIFQLYKIYSFCAYYIYIFKENDIHWKIHWKLTVMKIISIEKEMFREILRTQRN